MIGSTTLSRQCVDLRPLPPDLVTSEEPEYVEGPIRLDEQTGDPNRVSRPGAM